MDSNSFIDFYLSGFIAPCEQCTTTSQVETPYFLNLLGLKAQDSETFAFTHRGKKSCTILMSKFDKYKETLKIRQLPLGFNHCRKWFYIQNCRHHVPSTAPSCSRRWQQDYPQSHTNWVTELHRPRFDPLTCSTSSLTSSEEDVPAPSQAVQLPWTLQEIPL